MQRFLPGLVLAGALVLTGCGVGGENAREAAEQPEITKRQLAVMVLSAKELGAATARLELEDDAGIVANAEAADDSLDPDDTAKSLRSDGRLTGYELGYSHPKLLSGGASKGTLAVGTAVDLLEGPVYAAQYLHARLNDYELFKNALPGVKLSGYSTFDAATVGEEAGGQQVKIMVPGVITGYETDVYFRRGRVVAYVEVVRADREDARDEALELAAALDRRIQAVLAGELEVEPPKPEKSKETSAAELRSLPARTLAAADVAPGAVPVAEGPTEGDDYRGYYRNFEDVVVGGSHLIRLRGETQLYETPDDAAFAYRIFTEKAGRLIFAQAIIEAFADETGVRPTNVRARPLANAGRGARGMVVTFELVGAKYTMVGIFTRSGRHVQSVLGICRVGAFDPSDLEPVAERAQKRLV